MATNKQLDNIPDAPSHSFPTNQGPNENGRQPPKKRKKRNKKRKGQSNNVGGDSARPNPTTSQPGVSQPNQRHAQPGGSQQSKQQPGQANKPQQPPQGKQLNQNKRPNFGHVLLNAPCPLASIPIPVSVYREHDFPKFNDLPLELQKHIFEIAYHLSENIEHRERWIYTSRKVREWVEPFLYESIVLPQDFERNGSNERRLASYKKTFRSRPKEFYTKSVQRIFTNNSLKPGCSSSFELELLPVCDNLTNLECWSNPREELTTILRTKSWPKLKMLCLDIDLLPKNEDMFHLPIFQPVTHLNLTSNEPQLLSWVSLCSLTNLTHMRVYMLVQTKREEFRLAMDQTYAIATKAQKLEQKTAEDKRRWDHMESIRLGTFDPHVLLGVSGNWEEWADDGELSDVEDGECILVDYVQVMAALTYPSWPRDHFDRINGEDMDPWLEVTLKDRKL